MHSKKDTTNNVKTLFVAGCFGGHEGSFSKIAEQIFGAVKFGNVDYHNGGSFPELIQILKSVNKYKLIYWFADVLNDKPKLVKEIKKNHKACILVTSKRNTEGKYTFQDLLHHALGIKSNLFVEFSQKKDKYQGRVIDPLGNVFLNYNSDFSLVGKVLRKRVNELLSFTRMPSQKAGKKMEIPDEKEFFGLIKKYANIFHKLIHAHPEATNRFFGNASFRCERGFPSFKAGELIFVSRRNVDKRTIDKSAFVGTKRELPVKYFGEAKPSIDTPIQIGLYKHYPNIRYMLHSHAYIKGTPFTRKIIPCGALEEQKEVIKIFPDKNGVNFCVNLKGHGSLVLAADTKYLKKIPYIPRKMPEIHPGYAKGL